MHTNPSIRIIKGTIFEDVFELGGISYGEKGPDLKKFSGGPILKIEIFNAFLFILNYSRSKSPDDTGMNSCSFLIEFQEPQSFFHSFNLAPSISYSGKGGGGQIIQILGLLRVYWDCRIMENKTETTIVY